jgi:methylaspartate ammonia-lyase
MKVVKVLCVPGQTGFFTDDQAAIGAGAEHDGFTYVGPARTPGLAAIRNPGETVSVLLVLEDGQVAHGDCASVQYAGVGGRDPVFNPVEAIELIESIVAPRLLGRDLVNFREVAPEFDTLRADGQTLHTAIRYGVSQAVLDAVARTRGITMAEVIRDEYDTGASLRPVPIFAQSGDDRYNNVDKMILRRVAALPHGLINTVDDKLGRSGELLEAYVVWVRNRVLQLRHSPDYEPLLHFDVYGTVGMAFGADPSRMADYLARLGELAAPFQLRIEHPVDAGSRDAQIKAFAALRQQLKLRDSTVQLSVDEWCNTLDDVHAWVAAGAAHAVHVKTPDLGSVHNTAEALIAVRRAGLSAFCGGTCNETDRSAQVCAHVAMACEAELVLAKPGMGVDEGVMIVANEMARVHALAETRL